MWFELPSGSFAGSHSWMVVAGTRFCDAAVHLSCASEYCLLAYLEGNFLGSLDAIRCHLSDRFLRD